MRALRDSLICGRLAPGRQGLALGLGMAGALCVASHAAAPATPTTPTTPLDQASHPYFPLAVGNRWAYRCSTEGTPSAGKVLQIRQQLQRGGRWYFRAELRVGSDALPLVQYFSIDADGSVRRSLAAPSAIEAASGPDGAKPSGDVLLAADTAVGSAHGGWVSAGIERLPLPALPRAQALRIETFSLDSPSLPASQRAEWRARYYVGGVGPVGDADGLGGRCDLTAYRLAKRAVNRMSPR